MVHILKQLAGRRVQLRFATIWITERCDYFELYRDESNDWHCSAQRGTDSFLTGPCDSRYNAVCGVATAMGWDSEVA